ncbi:MAG: glycosyltransferase family 4 protein [Kineosporiaceae bacterium]|nr:glycosyltransferase family 4 protein [Kineosporiaceae bacterium]
MEPAKKVELLLHAFALSSLSTDGFTLVLVGGGSLLPELKHLSRELGIEKSVHFAGTTYDVDRLRDIYAHAACSVSPGYVGLSLTQSAGFGVPMAVARDEPHSPEIELAKLGVVEYFERDSAVDLACLLRDMCHRQVDDKRRQWSGYVRDFYSAEAMAPGPDVGPTQHAEFRLPRVKSQRVTRKIRR